MKQKFINFCKRPLLIISSLLLIVFTIITIVQSCLPYIKTTYKGTYNITATITVTSTYTLKDGVLEVKEETNNNGTITTESFSKDYYVNNGNIYVYEDSSNKFVKLGKISVFAITITDSSLNISYKNSSAIALRIVSIVFICISILLLSLSISLIYLNKKTDQITPIQIEETNNQ